MNYYISSTTREYRKQYWNEVVKHYYDVFNRTLAEFGLVLRHLGTTFNDFLYEVKRALRGQFLCVAFIIPIGELNTLCVSYSRTIATLVAKKGYLFR